MSDFERDFFTSSSSSTAGTTTGPLKKRSYRKPEQGLASFSLDDLPSREPSGPTVFAGSLGSVSYAEGEDDSPTMDQMSKKKQRGHRRTMDYLQNFSIQVLSSLGQLAKDVTTLDISPTAGSTEVAVPSENVNASSNRENAFNSSSSAKCSLSTIAEVAALSHPFHKPPIAFADSVSGKKDKGVPKSSIASAPVPAHHTYDRRAYTAHTDTVQKSSGSASAHKPPEGTTLPPKAKTPKNKNSWPSAMLTNVVNLAQMFMVANPNFTQYRDPAHPTDMPGTSAVVSDDGDSEVATASSTTDHHGRLANSQGWMEPPDDALNSHSFSTDSYDSRFTRMHMGEPPAGCIGTDSLDQVVSNGCLDIRVPVPGPTWRDCPTPTDAKDFIKSGVASRPYDMNEMPTSGLFRNS